MRFKGHCSFAIAVLLLLGHPPATPAHETDQFTMPIGREFADLRYWLSAYFYDAIDAAVEKTNLRIRRSLVGGQPTPTTVALQSPKTIATAVNHEFPRFIRQVEVIERELASSRVTSGYPGLIVAHRPPHWIYHHPALVIDLARFARLIRCSTIMGDGSYFGVDKILHFCQIGFIYFGGYQKALDEGATEDEAIRRAVDLGTGRHGSSENSVVGALASGVISNGDLAANYVGLKFYRNLTEPVKFKGKVQPPILVRDGEYFRLNNHVRRDADFFNVFICDNWNEALNPSKYTPGVEPFVREEVQKRCPEILDWYRDEQGRVRSDTEFLRIAHELSTYYGEDYGHQGNLHDLASVASVCFQPTAAVEDLAVSADFVDTIGVPKRGIAVLSAHGPLNGRDCLGRTALWRACSAGHLELAQELMTTDAGVNIADVDGETPLHAAARLGHAALVELLLRNGAAPSSRNIHGLTPLHLASRGNNVEVVDLLLAAGAEINLRDSFGCTPLHDAATQAGVTVFARLVQAGAEIDAPDRFGMTALQRTTLARRAEIAAVLSAAGLDHQERKLNRPQRAGEVATGRGSGPTRREADGHDGLGGPEEGMAERAGGHMAMQP